MEVIYHDDKDAANIAKHGISLGRANDFDFDSANYAIDDREDYGETRYVALGFIEAQLHVLVFTEVPYQGIRAISLRKASKQEQKRYAED